MPISQEGGAATIQERTKPATPINGVPIPNPLEDPAMMLRHDRPTDRPNASRLADCNMGRRRSWRHQQSINSSAAVAAASSFVPPSLASMRCPCPSPSPPSPTHPILPPSLPPSSRNRRSLARACTFFNRAPKESRLSVVVARSVRPWVVVGARMARKEGGREGGRLQAQLVVPSTAETESERGSE